MNQIKIYLLLSILINFVMICCGFLVGQIDGDLVDGMQMRIGMYFIGSPDKYLMQAIDTKQNKFSIKTSKTFSQYYDNKLIIDFNGLFTTIDTSTTNYFYKRYDDIDEIFRLSIKFQFKQNNLYVGFGSSSLLLLSNIHNQYYYDNNNNQYKKNVSNSNKEIKSSDWPNDENIHKLTNQTKIWFGYFNNNNQYIAGCIHGLEYINKKDIKLNKKGNIDNFYNDYNDYCYITRVNKSICNQYGSCINTTNNDYNILNCKSEINTEQFCYRDLSNNNIDLLNLYERIGDQRKSIIINLAWVTQQSINHCLVEIITRNNSLIEIYLNSTNQIILAIKHDKSIIWSKHILYEISSNQIHILRIELTESNSTFLVSNGKFVQILNFPKLGSVKLINVGWNSRTNLCKKLNGKFVFRYDSNQLRLLNESSISYWIIFLIMTISISCNILICIVWIIGKIKKKEENVPNVPTLNPHGKPIEMKNLTEDSAVIEKS